MGLYRPTVTKKREDGAKYTIKSRVWWGSFRHPVTDQVVRTSLRTRDKSAAKTLLGEAERRAALEHAGLVSPYEQHEKRPIQEHVDDFEKQLLDKGTTAKHAKLVSNRVRWMVEDCGFAIWADLTASAVQACIGRSRANEISTQTRNFYLQAIKQFARWMVADKRAAESPVGHLRGENVRTDRRHDRRPLTEDELRRLLATTRGGPTRFGMTGPDRAVLYRLAVETGLRAGEVRSLTPESFDLGGQPPTVTVLAAYSKHRKEDVQPLPVPLVADLQGFVADRPAGVPVFLLPDKPAMMLKADLEDAGIPYRDDAGRVADFHALRHTFITNLARGGVHPKDAQQLARHSSITLTMDRYSHTVVGEVAGALANLPDLSNRDPATERRRATGTDVAAARGPERVCTNVVQTGALDGHSRSSGGRKGTPNRSSDETAKGTQMASSGRSRHVPSSPVTKATVRTRTGNLRFTKPLLCQLSYGGKHRSSYRKRGFLQPPTTRNRSRVPFACPYPAPT